FGASSRDSAERGAFAAVRRYLVDHTIARHEEQRREALTELTGLRVTEEDGVAGSERRAGWDPQRRLHLARTLVREQLEPIGQPGPRELGIARRTRGDVATAETR
ncbi:hypothetical protein RZS08_04065, partial [Arthrospira platensis SPKY1]|nr:hypothetical protein [Arthrospira platensis SPKY1]